MATGALWLFRRHALGGLTRSHIFLCQSLPLGCAVPSVVPLRCPASVSLFIWLRLPSPGPAFGTHSSNTTRLVSLPGPQDTRSFMPLCLSLMRFLQLECLPAPAASSAWQTPISLSQAPPPGRHPSPLSSGLPLHLVNASLVAPITAYFTCLHVCLPF